MAAADRRSTAAAHRLALPISNESRDDGSSDEEYDCDLVVMQLFQTVARKEASPARGEGSAGVRELGRAIWRRWRWVQERGRSSRDTDEESLCCCCSGSESDLES
ncbi:hypothetical protein E2562_037235 [Oryza meyeriana var. granulata]|uniref:Uncharacterized protein n=1 Tax=Oryza meyeriana var. granulata TaxID=110450 RepID=A0A6G1ETS2_9ORYZ|nr:hypothetical protein E2562_037235 [Oryza meyeriana var. granulata]